MIENIEKVRRKIQPEYYYVTICTYNRILLFGEIINNYKEPVGSQRAVTATNVPGICLNQYGKIVCEEWENTQCLRRGVDLDEYIIMPNHIHGIIIIYKSDTARRVPTGQFGKPISGSLSTIIRSFKSAVTKRINELRKTTILPIWQRSSGYDDINSQTRIRFDGQNYLLAFNFRFCRA